MHAPSYVLLYDSWTSWDDYTAVELKLLSQEHPFTNLLLHQGSRSCEESRKHWVTQWERRPQLWSLADPDYHSGFGKTTGYRRQKLGWTSAHGPPHEEHLLLYHCLAAWVKEQKSLTLGAFQTPFNIVGSVRLDDGEHCGNELEICHCYITITEPDSIEGASEEDGMHGVESPRTADSDQVSRHFQPLSMRVDSDDTRLASAVGVTMLDAEAASVHDCAGLEQDAPQIHVESGDTDIPLFNQKHPDVKAHQQLSNEKGTSWHCQNFFFLKHTVLSCSEGEVQELLREFMEIQAHAQCRMLKAELLEHVHSFSRRAV
ncbi:hypothetical protein ABBQ32_002943 [Trebouxia sp. C0010 RCD-2024]